MGGLGITIGGGRVEGGLGGITTGITTGGFFHLESCVVVSGTNSGRVGFLIATGDWAILGFFFTGGGCFGAVAVAVRFSLDENGAPFAAAEK